MRILIDIGHPAHVHMFRPIAKKMLRDGHSVLFTFRDKEYERELINDAQIQSISLGKHYRSTAGKVLGLLIFNFRLFMVALKFKPDFFISHGSIYAAQVSWLYRKPHISFEDTENLEQIRLYRPFTDLILAPECIIKDLGPKMIKYKGYHAINYLHPDVFKPDPNVYSYLKIPPGSIYFLLRFVGLNATHDHKIVGLTNDNVDEIIKILKPYGKIFITSEKELLPKYDKYRIKIPPEKMHDAIAFASLLIGESGVMSTEAAILGVPNIVIANIDQGVHKSLANYGLKYHFHYFNLEVIATIQSILVDIKSTKKEWNRRSVEFVDSCIDMNKLLFWLLQDYPVRKKRLLNIKQIQDEKYV